MRAVLLFLLLAPLLRAGDELPGILSMRKRAELQDQWLQIRFKTVLPQIMRREQVDMWILIAREYNEDPVILSMLPAKWMSARRRTILVFHDPGPDQPIESLAVSRYHIGELQSSWDKEKQPDQWARLMEIIKERDPKRIALNISDDFALGDGLSHSQHRAFMKNLPANYKDRIVSGERLAIGWLETRTPEEMWLYPQICNIAHHLIAEGFSSKVVHPGITTTADVEWYLRERVRELKMTAWFHPSVSIQRAESGARANSFAGKPGTKLIRPGDLLHVDFGITYLGLNTDTQQHAYVLRPGETEAPAGLVKALAVGNRLQDILTEQFKTGRSGNDILAGALAQAKQENIKATIYTHPIGYHGHGAGPTIGLWDMQGGVPGKGDYPLYTNTAHSIELNAAVEIPEWQGKSVRIMLEEDGFWGEAGFSYIDGRQESLILIR